MSEEKEEKSGLARFTTIALIVIVGLLVSYVGSFVALIYSHGLADAVIRMGVSREFLFALYYPLLKLFGFI